MADASIRQRSTKTTTATTANDESTSSKTEKSGSFVSLLDVLRVLVTIVVATLAVSYYTTSGESLIYGYNPWFLNPAKVRAWYQGPRELTLEELAKYDGSNPDLPIYIAVNGTIFDVTEGRRMYGKGGGYNVFAGRDASRAFVTGCFQEDRTHDMRGAELIYLPIEDAPDEEITKEERKIRAQQERQQAKQQAHDEVARWYDFFSNSPKYPTVGKVIGLKKPRGASPSLCDYAQKGRPKRSEMIAHQKAAQADAA